MEQRASITVAKRDERTRVLRQPLFYVTLVLLLVALALVTRAVRADDMHLLINGKAIHLDHQPNVHYNESNWGAGFQYDFDRSQSSWVPFVTASGFLDSNKNPSYYAGGGYLKRFDFTAMNTPMHADIGWVGFLMTRKGFMNDKPFPGILPAFSVGSERVSMNVTYIPRVDPKMVPIVFFQLKIKLASF